MITNLSTLIYLIISTILILLLMLFINHQSNQTKIKKSFRYILVCLLIWCVGLIAQITLSKKLGLSPIYFDYVTYIGTCFLPVAFLFTSLIFSGKITTFKRKHLLLFVIPIFSLLVLWTNDFHHLFYQEY